MRVKTIFLGSFLVIFSYFMTGLAEQPYQDITPQGKIISGLSEEEALNKYGVPSTANNDLWYYSEPEKLYVYLQRPLGVYLYPRFSNGYVGFPLELKVFAGQKEITDVTQQAELLISEPEKFNIVGQGVIVPKKAGDYQFIASYKGAFSNAGFISVAETNKKAAEAELLSIDTFPYKPYASVGNTLNFFAFGTFAFKSHYTVRDISDEAEWFSGQNNETLKLKNSRVALLSPGKFKVFCSYKGLESLPQDVEVSGSPFLPTPNIKQVSIVPAQLSMAVQEKVSFRAFATCDNNTIEEVTTRITWEILNKRVLVRESGSTFIAKSSGIAEVRGVLDKMQSLPVKVTVSSIPASKATAPKIDKQKGNLKDLLEDIKDDAKKLKKKITAEEKFKQIKIIPDYCDIPAGEEKQLLAMGVRNDNSEENITILAKWIGFDSGIANVKTGLVNAISPGETKVCAQYKGLESQYVPLIVREPRLIAISVSPSSLKIAMGDKSNLKAQGIFSDSSQHDITTLVKWICVDSGVVRIDKGSVSAIGVGKTKIYAEYSGVQSPLAEVVVARDKYWLLKLIAKILFFLFLTALILYSYFYILTKQAKERILKKHDNPKDFIIALYGNLNKVTDIFGLRQKYHIPPLFFASLADEKYGIKDKLFFKFTQTYEEAKYSAHTFLPETSRIALDAYNHILKTMFRQNRKIKLIYLYYKALFNKVPFFIHSRP